MSISIHPYPSQKISNTDLKNMLTRKDIRNWLDSSSMSIKSNNSYCHLCCININTETIGKHCGSHTLCKYPNNQTGPACKGYIVIEFSHPEREAILDVHNTLRNLVASGEERRGTPGPQPPASNMRAMQWDNELALIAKRWAAQCIYANDACRDVERFPVGQNIAHGNLATRNDLLFIKEWYDEVENFNSSDVERFKLSSQNKHIFNEYTQVIWADTYLIGCARAVFQVSRGPNVVYREHFICNYGPIGNIPNQPAYLIGKACTACHEGTSCLVDYPALCGGEMIQSVEIQEQQERIHTQGSDTVILEQEFSNENRKEVSFFIILLYFLFILSACSI